jgi:hypothetical protein
MCKPSSAAPSEEARFHPDVKCCTFMPHLPNYVVGQIVRDDTPDGREGRATVSARIDAGLGVTPFGLDATPMYALLYAHKKTHTFGTSRALRCPHYIERAGGLCGIWRYRNSVCSTYYCQFVRGAVGRAFWSRLRQLLAEVEYGLERWCVEQLEVDTATVGELVRLDNGSGSGGLQLSADDIEGRPDRADYARKWGATWRGREREFYVAASDLVERLTWREVVAICGVRLRQYARITLQSYNALVRTELPARLGVGSFAVTRADSNFVFVRAHDARDAMVLPRQLLDVLPVFDGDRSVEEAVAEARAGGVYVSSSIVRQLVDFHILVETHGLG